MTGPSRYNVPRQWLPFLGPKLGLATGLYHLAADPDDFDLHQVFPTVTAVARLLGHQHALNPRAGGAGTRLEDAMNRAMGELLERYAFFAYDGTSQVLLSYRELIERGCRPVPFENLVPFSREQYRSESFPYAEFTEATRAVWVEGTNLLDGLPSFVPGQLVSVSYFHSTEEIPQCFYPTSSGCAVATSVDEALLKGLLELIERDAVMIRWYARLPPPMLDLDPTDLMGEPPGLQTHRLEIRFHDLTLDGDVPVVGVTCVERTGRPCFFILSAASALDVSAAARKALVESGQGRPFVKSMASTSEALLKGAAFCDFESNLRFYAEPSNARYVEWFLQNKSLSTRKFPTAIQVKDPLKSLTALLDCCADMAVTPIAFDMTTPEMQDSGLFACRVFVPELVPLCVPSAPFLGHVRLARFIASSKQQGKFESIPEWVPHPFP
jgi:ribosomal protein S12 methylthiotransferase accessory factor